MKKRVLIAISISVILLILIINLSHFVYTKVYFRDLQSIYVTNETECNKYCPRMGEYYYGECKTLSLNKSEVLLGSCGECPDCFCYCYHGKSID